MIGVSLGLLAGLLSLATVEQEVRPWQVSSDMKIEFRDRFRTATDAAELSDLASWCLQRGLYASAQEALDRLLTKAPRDPQVRAQYGHAAHADGWRWRELERFVEQPAAPPVLPDVDPKWQAALVKEHDRPLAPSKRSAYFELQTDLPAEQAIFYGRGLDKHFRELKTRFRAYRGGEIEVLLFANRSDYLRAFLQATGKSFENIAGFYYQDHLVFYDDPYNREETVNTALHECTHLLLDRCYQRAVLPRWLHEGMACYFAADGEAASGVYTAGLLYNVHREQRRAVPMELADLMDLPREKFEYRHYALAWSWIHFLNVGRQQKKFQKYLEDLRDQLQPEMDEVESVRLTNLLMKEAFAGDVEARQLGWTEYFQNQFALRSPQQILDYAWHCLGEARVADVAQSRTRALAQAQFTLDLAAFIELPAEEQPRRELGRARLLLERLYELIEDNPLHLRLGLATVQAEVDRLSAAVDPADVGLLALECLRVLDRLVDRLQEPAGPDLRTRLLRWRDGLKGEEAALALALVVQHDELKRLAEDSFHRALVQDPLHLPALQGWLLLGLDIAPAILPALFDRVRLATEVNPDDTQLAHLALIYGGLGDREWGRLLLAEAKARSGRPGYLDWCDPYLD